jgi:hypothetical protein
MFLVVTIISSKRFGLTDTGQRRPEGNATAGSQKEATWHLYPPPTPTV